MKCVPKWYLRLDFTFKSSKVAIFFGQISEISFQSHLIFIIQSFRNFEAGYIWKFICYEVRFGKVRFGSVKITGPVRFGKSGICLVRSTTDPVGFGRGEDCSNRIPCIYFIFIIYSSFSYNSHLHDPTPNQFTHIFQAFKGKNFFPLWQF